MRIIRLTPLAALARLLWCATLVAAFSASLDRSSAQDLRSATRPQPAGQSNAWQGQVNARRPGKAAADVAPTSKSQVTLASAERLVASEIIVDEPGEAVQFNHATADCDCPQCNPIGLCPPADYGACARDIGLWVSAEYLLWSLEGMDLPAMLTTSPVGTAAANTGVIDLATTTTLLEGNVGGDFRSGGRVTVGLWLDPTREVSWEADYLGIGSSSDVFSANSLNSPNLARPVFDTLLGTESAMLIAQSSFLSGSISIAAASELQAFEVIRRERWCSDGFFNFDLLLGYKYAALEDRLSIAQSSSYFAARGPILAGTTQTLSDRFEAENSFNGVLIGLERRHRWDRWLVGYMAKISVGSNHSTVSIDGQTITTVPNAGSSTFNGGLLAQQSNIGRHGRNEVVVIPEFAFSLKRQLTDCLRLQSGYSVMYWSSAMRASDAISRRVSQLPPEPISGVGEPKFDFSHSGFLAHGFQFGLECKY